MQRVPHDLHVPVEAQVRVLAWIQAERKRMLRRVVCGGLTLISSGVLMIAGIALTDLWERVLEAVPGGMGYSDYLQSLVWYQPLPVLAPLIGSTLTMGMLGLIGSVMALSRPRTPHVG